MEIVDEHRYNFHSSTAQKELNIWKTNGNLQISCKRIERTARYSLFFFAYAKPAIQPTVPSSVFHFMQKLDDKVEYWNLFPRTTDYHLWIILIIVNRLSNEYCLHLRRWPKLWANKKEDKVSCCHSISFTLCVVVSAEKWMVRLPMEKFLSSQAILKIA